MRNVEPLLTVPICILQDAVWKNVLSYRYDRPVDVKVMASGMQYSMSGI